MHSGWSVLVKDNKIVAVGMGLTAGADAKVIDLEGCTLLPGLIEGHSHLFLHPYNETSWDDQVLKEPRAERVARGAAARKKNINGRFYDGSGFGDGRCRI